MKMKYMFEMVDMGNEVIAVPIGNGAENVHGVLKLNKEALEIVELLRAETTEEQIINTLAGKYENDRQTLSDYVQQVIAVLRNTGLVED